MGAQGAIALGHVLGLFLAQVAEGCGQAVGAAEWMAGGDFLLRGLEPGVGFDAVHLAGLDEAGHTIRQAGVAVSRRSVTRPRITSRRSPPDAGTRPWS